MHLRYGTYIMATESEKPQETPAAASPPADKPAPKPVSKPGQPPRKPQRGGGGGHGGDKRRPRDSVPRLDSEFDFKDRQAPNVRDLDAEIAAELEAALQGMDDKSFYSADDSKRAREQADAQGEGRKKKGRVVSVHGPDVFIDIPGGRGQGVLSMENFPDGPPKPGTEVEVNIEGYDGANGLLLLSCKGSAVVADWSSVAEGMVVEARVLETNKGGLSVDVNGIRGFMPMAQIDRFRTENAEQFVGQKLLCIVTDVDKEDRNLIVSRRALQEKEREEQRKKLWEELEEGQIRSGIIGNVREFGAFVDIGGVDGLLHVSEISWQRIPDATKVLQAGQMVKVVVLKIDREKQKLSLGLKQLEPSPWDNITEKFAAGRTVKGTVTRTMDFGAFVELEPGVEGLIHISELARNKVWRATDVVKIGQEVEVKVLSVDPEAKRISLSLRQALPEEIVANPEDDENAHSEEDLKPRVPSTRELKGGIGGATWKYEKPTEPEA